MKYNLQDIIKRYDEGEHLEYVFFWGHHAKPGQVTKACFSQWYPCVFEVDGVTHNCAEQYMMAGKARAFNDEETLGKILSVSDPKIIKALGREVKNFDTDKWAAVSKDIVVKGNLHKFAQNIKLFQFLRETGNRVLVEASPYDTIWGIGMKESDTEATRISTATGNVQVQLAIIKDGFLKKDEKLGLLSPSRNYFN